MRVSKYVAKHLRQPAGTAECSCWTAADGGRRRAAGCLRGDGFASPRRAGVRGGRQREAAVRFDASGRRIRANQAHGRVGSICRRRPPPDVLFHGRRAVLPGQAGRVAADGSAPRAPVRRSATARAGRRPARYADRAAVDAAAMTSAGHVFCISSNGVWLVDTSRRSICVDRRLDVRPGRGVPYPGGRRRGAGAEQVQVRNDPAQRVGGRRAGRR